ncbi:MAG: hypothetical protein HQ538_06270 [Parcubacteria group bacterium]|nr:hypothetical protein [Parcubacteria group bacterium]
MITDSIEGCFSFRGLDTNNYLFSKEIFVDASYSEILKMAIDMEGKIQRFYLDAVEVSMVLIADIARAFERIAKGRGKRKPHLEKIYNKYIVN